MALELLQFPYSHYNEKARWALDWKGIPHQRVSLLPGPHVPRIRRLTGATEVPVLRVDGEVVAGSARILAELERRFPARPLLPEEPALREEALRWQAELDAELGPAVRAAVFLVTLPTPGYVCRTFAGCHPWPVRGLYRAGFPIVSRLMRSRMGLDAPGTFERAVAVSERALDRVARASEATGQLVGDRFTVADLTAASLLAPLVALDHPDMARPRPMPAALETFLARFAAHPGVQWVQAQYRLHRPLSANVD